MKKAEEQILRAIATKAKSVAPKDATIMLYGSRARGDNRNDSDWDLLILLNKDKITLNDIDEVEYPIREMGWNIGEDINPILYTKKDWSDSSFTPFYKNVVQDSIVFMSLNFEERTAVNDRFDLTEEEVLPLVEPAEELIKDVSKMAMQSLNNRIIIL